MKLRKITALLNHKKFMEEMKKSGLTQEEFAEEIDISDRYVRNLASRDMNVSVSIAYSISQVFGVDIEDMLIVIKEDEQAGQDLQR